MQTEHTNNGEAAGEAASFALILFEGFPEC